MPSFFLFFFNDTATTEIYTLSLHDALPIYTDDKGRQQQPAQPPRLSRTQHRPGSQEQRAAETDRKSTRLNSSHQIISYAVFCLKKKIKLRAFTASRTPNGDQVSAPGARRRN